MLHPAFGFGILATVVAEGVSENGGATIGDALILALVGVAVVFGALLLTLVVVSTVSYALRERPAPAGLAKSSESPAPAADEAIDERTRVLVAAAVYAAVGPQARVVRVRRLQREISSVWTQHGRVLVQSSHRARTAPRVRK